MQTQTKPPLSALAKRKRWAIAGIAAGAVFWAAWGFAVGYSMADNNQIVSCPTENSCSVQYDQAHHYWLINGHRVTR